MCAVVVNPGAVDTACLAVNLDNLCFGKILGRRA